MWYSYLGLAALAAVCVALFVCSLVVLDAADSRKREREHFDE